MKRILPILLVLFVTCFLTQSNADGQTRAVSQTRPAEPGWTSRVIKRGAERTISKNTPIEQRPYRPLHFYGNTVRRRYYRPSQLPAPRNLLRTNNIRIQRNR